MIAEYGRGTCDIVTDEDRNLNDIIVRAQGRATKESIGQFQIKNNWNNNNNNVEEPKEVFSNEIQ